MLVVIPVIKFLLMRRVDLHHDDQDSAANVLCGMCFVGCRHGVPSSRAYVQLCGVVPMFLLYTGMVRCVWARPTRAVSSRCPAMTRTPSSILRTIFSGVQVSRNAMPRARQAAKTRSRASCISGGYGSRGTCL